MFHELICVCALLAAKSLMRKSLLGIKSSEAMGISMKSYVPDSTEGGAMQLLEQIKAAGIVGCGGAGFPTHAKLSCQVEYLIVNAAECEPLLRTDRYLMMHKSREIITAAGLMAEMVQARQAVIALKETYIKEIEALEAAIETLNSPVRLFKMKNFYPAGDEQIMVCEVTGRTVPPAGIPLDVGAVVSNTATVYCVYQASLDQPFTHKYLTVTGEVASPVILHAPLGSSFDECLKAAGGTNLTSYHVLAGGPLMGKLYTREEAASLAVTKTTSGFVLVPDHIPLVQKRETPLSFVLHRAKTSCIQCSYCTQLCPRYLTGHPLRPHMIMRSLAYAENPSLVLDEPAVRHAMICSECGLCETYACPMGLSPRQVNVHLKALLRQQNYRYPKPEESFQCLEERDYRRVPSKRMAMRLGVDPYYDYQIQDCLELSSSCVRLFLSQHIGVPSVPVVQKGDKVSQGQLIAAVPDKALGANLHASISGYVEDITDSEIVIQYGS